MGKNDKSVVLACWFSVVVCGGVLLLTPNQALAEKSEAAKETRATTKALDAEMETVCETDIFYTWKRIIPPKKDDNKADKAATPTPEPEPIEVFFTRTGERGLYEAVVKQRLALKVPSLKAAAILHCEDLHQASSRCVAQQLNRASSTYTRLDFAARRAFLDAVTQECSLRSGVCLSARAGAIHCYQNAPGPVQRPHADEGKDTEEKKEEGKAKKKK